MRKRYGLCAFGGPSPFRRVLPGKSSSGFPNSGKQNAYPGMPVKLETAGLLCTRTGNEAVSQTVTDLPSVLFPTVRKTHEGLLDRKTLSQETATPILRPDLTSGKMYQPVPGAGEFDQNAWRHFGWRRT